jgi:hypothetical protein
MKRIKAFSKAAVEFCHPEAAVSLAKPRPPNEGSLYRPAN